MELLNIDGRPVPPHLLKALREWRHQESRTHSIPAYWILSNRLLIQIAADVPRTVEELGAIKGMGPARTERYGEAILAVLADAGPATPPPPASSPPGEEVLRPTRVSYPLPTRCWAEVLAAAHVAVPGTVAGMDLLISLQT